jgi:hypothetical protein
MSDEYGGRVFDRIERVDPRSFDYLYAATSAYMSAEDKILQGEIDALTKRVSALEATIGPVAPTPAPTPPPTPPKPAAIVWACGQVLDQGPFGMCVGYAWAGLAMSAPTPETIIPGKGGDDEGSTPDAIYDQAQIDDGSPPDPQSGASTTGGAQASKQLGFIRSYTWALNTNQITAALTHGPVVVGMPWRSTMMDPDAHGVLNVGTKVDDVGGHEFLIPRYFPAGAAGNPSATVAMYGMRQSWGASWGLAGDAFIPVAGLADMLADGGDCAVPSK